MPSIREDIGQLLWFGFAGTTMPAWLVDELAAGDCGNVILFKRNLVIEAGPDGERIDVIALRVLNDALHAAGAGQPPVWVAVDQEGGVVQRLRAPATRWPPMMALAKVPAAEAEALAEACGYAMGVELAAVGFDVDFAPVLDVHTNPANPIIGDRAFATTAVAAARHALAWARGLAAADVIGCGKHFPGHGDTDTDSHLALPVVRHDAARLRAVELAPFAEAARAGLPMLMTAHVVFDALVPGVPATLAPEIIGGLLRDELGYQGLVVSDDLDMKAIAANVGVGEAAVRAIEAGCDLLLLCADRDHQIQAREALTQAAAEPAFAQRVAQAAARVRAAKQALAARGPRPSLNVLADPAHQALAARLDAAYRAT